MPHHHPGQWGGGKHGLNELAQVGMVGILPGQIAQHLAIFAGDCRLLQVPPQIGIQLFDLQKALPHHHPVLARQLILIGQAAEALEVFHGQRRVTAKLADPVGQLEQVIDLDGIDLHGRGGGQPQALCLCPKRVLQGDIQITVFGIAGSTVAGILAARVMCLVQQNDVKVFGGAQMG